MKQRSKQAQGRGPTNTSGSTDGKDDTAPLEWAEAAAVAAPPERPPLDAAPPETPDSDTRKLLKSLEKQQKKHLEQALAEAKEMGRKAKELAKTARAESKVRGRMGKHADRVRQLAPQLGLDPDRPVTAIPEPGRPDLTQIELATMQEGFSYIRVLFDTANNRYLYEAIEPSLSAAETEVLAFLRDTLVRTMEGRQTVRGAAEADAYLRDTVDRAILDHSILVDDVSRERLKYYLVRDLLGYGPIDVLMRDPLIEDISCDGPGIPIYLFHRQYESVRTNIVFENELALDSFVIRLAQRCGKHISIADPLLDATLPDTSRLQATLSREVTTRGSSFTVRKFRADPLTPSDLVRLGTMSSAMAAFFWFAMEYGNSLLLAGGTASGKTTTLNAVSQFIPPEKKIVSIEDTREINLRHENWIAGLTRSGFGGEIVAGKLAGSIDMYKLLEAALRQRPEYLLVGEVRGPEALTLFQAMATGHATYSTLHADSASTAVHRLENEPINVPRIMLQTLNAVAVQVQVRLNKRMVRRIKEVTEIVGIDAETGDLLTNAVFQWDPATDKFAYLGKSVIFESIRAKNNLSMERIEEEWANRTMILDWMHERGIRHIDDVASVISEYYRRPEVLLAKVRASRGHPGPAKGGTDGAQ